MLHSLHAYANSDQVGALVHPPRSLLTRFHSGSKLDLGLNDFDAMEDLAGDA
jgi:hypothetical protein